MRVGRTLSAESSPADQSSERTRTVDAVIASGVIAILRLDVADLLLPVAQAIRRGGITAIEFSLTTPGALVALHQAASQFGDEVVLGAGTVLNAAAANEAIDAGARFVVSPVSSPSVIDACHHRDVAVFPGALTPTEIQSAWEAGADLVKLFPADFLGPRYVRSLLAPLPYLKLLPTGGVTAANASAFMAAGAVAVASSGVASGATSKIPANARQLKAAVDKARPVLQTAI